MGRYGWGSGVWRDETCNAEEHPLHSELTNLYLFSSILKNYIVTTTHHKNEIQDGE